VTTINIFLTDTDPILAAQSLPDKHIVKMPVEAVQMAVSVLIRHGIDYTVLTKAGTNHKGGYHSHPCTVWAGDSRANLVWLLEWGNALCAEYTKRYGKIHFAQGQLTAIWPHVLEVPAGLPTTPAQAMPDECKVPGNAVEAYRNCIRAKVASKPDSFVWKKGTPSPDWL
jgi:hypothetical protein